ncbi:restriction endonuclease subunit S [Helicobacter pylori]|uniref:restriction endonuclease subunit S n=1 Tax=Helicobacter pylori TaxID=210 RepID=UPI00111977AF|nr:restriction endonuclease subunit S [Helicobacter pylori]
MIGPLSSQLNAIKWGEFRLGDLFEMERGARLTKANRIKGTRPLVTAGYENYGVAEYISNHDQKVFKGNTITIDMFANAFYRYSEYSADDNILVLTPKFTMSYRIGLCVTARINAVLKAKFSYGKQYRQKDFNVTIISLPLKPTAKTQTLDDIDFDFMEKFIAELEQCRLAELQAYLKATGLENTTLSSDEENALNVFNNSIGGGGGNTPCGLTWQSFRLGDLFEASNGDFDIQKRHINHKGEFVITAGLSNNGVLGQSDIQAKVFESHTITIDMFGCAFYRSFAYKMVTHARVFSLKPKFEINHKIGLFLSTLFFGYPKKFGYENMCSWVKIKNDKVILPLKPTANTQSLEDIDFHFMHTFINALMKQTIQGVAQYCSAKIQATKEVINQETPVQKDSLF